MRGLVVDSVLPCGIGVMIVPLNIGQGKAFHVCCAVFDMAMDQAAFDVPNVWELEHWNVRLLLRLRSQYVEEISRFI